MCGASRRHERKHAAGIGDCGNEDAHGATGNGDGARWRNWWRNHHHDRIANDRHTDVQRSDLHHVHMDWERFCFCVVDY